MNNLIGISGHIGSGKDTVGQMIQELTTPKRVPDENGLIDRGILVSPYRIVKFADKLKDCVCLILGCTREQLEDSRFKEKELGEEWNVFSPTGRIDGKGYIGTSILCSSKEEALKEAEEYYDYYYGVINQKLTPRKILQLLGTECGRRIIHPNIWVNATFADWKKGGYDSTGMDYCIGSTPYNYPNWIITDVRFPNEAKAIKERGGILIRVERGPFYHYFEEEGCHKWSEKEDRTGCEWNYSKEHFTKEESLKRVKIDMKKDQHPSETALDDYKDWDYVIDNNGTLEDLLTKVKEIYDKEGNS